MNGFLKIDGELLEIPGLSYGAMMLYAFIKLRLNIAEEDANGNKYINYMDANDPRAALKASSKLIWKWTKELSEHNLIYTDGRGISFKVYLATEFIHVKKDPENKVNYPNGKLTENAEEKVNYPNGELKKTRGQIRLPKREVDNYPNGKLTTTQMGSRPLLSYKEHLNNTKSIVYIYEDPELIPSLEEVEAEAHKKGYTVDCAYFIEYNNMKGWRITDWRAALALFDKNTRSRKPAGRRYGSITGAEAGIISDLTPAADPEPITDAGAAYDNIIDIFEAQ